MATNQADVPHSVGSESDGAKTQSIRDGATNGTSSSDGSDRIDRKTSAAATRDPGAAVDLAPEKRETADDGKGDGRSPSAEAAWGESDFDDDHAASPYAAHLVEFLRRDHDADGDGDVVGCRKPNRFNKFPSLNLHDLTESNPRDDDHDNEFSYGSISDLHTSQTLDAGVVSALRTNRMQCDMLASTTSTHKGRTRVPIMPQTPVVSENPRANRQANCTLTASLLRREAVTLGHLENLKTEITSLERKTKRMDWMRSFKMLDPRFQILEFFNDLSLWGVEQFEGEGCRAVSSNMAPKLLRGFTKAGIFSVWRPTSDEAIRKMITGEGTGKGLDIKGKSAKRGVYSGFVPFLQIHENDHKSRIETMRKDKRVRVFYPNKFSRDTAVETLRTFTFKIAPKQQRKGSLDLSHIMDATRRTEDPLIYDIDKYAKTQGVYGLDAPEALFWEGYVVPNDISRKGEYETGRPSMPEFQQMNVETLRKGGGESDTGPRPVLWHGGCGRPGEGAAEGSDPMCPIDLLMAYEENNKVTPVVSDFDCFLLGTRAIKMEKTLGQQELSMLSFCVDEIEGILENPVCGSSWTTRWLEVKKKHINDPAHKVMPPFGFADPRSYSIMTGAVHKLKSNGAVRHGPECFNYSFPQDLDEQYLVISDMFHGVPWRYTDAEGLIDILSKKVDQGFTFPLNPKWILCDPGWKTLYDKLMASQKPNVQDSLSIWYPNSIRDRINEIAAKHPQGFADTSQSSGQSASVRVDLAQLELLRYEFSQEKKKTSSIDKFKKALRRWTTADDKSGN